MCVNYTSSEKTTPSGYFFAKLLEQGRKIEKKLSSAASSKKSSKKSSSKKAIGSAKVEHQAQTRDHLSTSAWQDFLKAEESENSPEERPVVVAKPSKQEPLPYLGLQVSV